MKKKWWKEAVCYQIYPRSFKDSNGDGIGDLRGVIEKLDYIKELGIDVIWICPIYKSPNDDNGYDISDYQDIMDEFGTMEDFDELLAEIHKRDMKLIMDLVLNHTSDEHPWFIESRSSKNNAKRDWYIWRDKPNNWESTFNGSAWEYDEKTEQYYLHVYSIKQPDLNMENPEVREALVEMINWWLEKGIDGFRMDAITHIKKKPGLPDLPNPNGLRFVDSNPFHRNIEGIHDFLKEFKKRTYENYDVMTVGEANGVPMGETSLWVGEEQGHMNMIFQFEHMSLDFGKEGRWDRGQWRLKDLKKVLTVSQEHLEGMGWNALFLENHDQPRSISRFGDTLTFHKESAKMLAAFYILMKGTPFIYQGQEIGMTNISFDSVTDYQDVEIHNYFRERLIDGKDEAETMERIRYRARDNARTPMQWNTGRNAGFTTGNPWIGVNPNYPGINVEQQMDDPDSILNFYKKLLKLRKENECLIYGKYSLIMEDHPAIYAYERMIEDQIIAVLCNFTKDHVEIPKEMWKGDFILGNVSNPKPTVLKPFEVKVIKR